MDGRTRFAPQKAQRGKDFDGVVLGQGREWGECHWIQFQNSHLTPSCYRGILGKHVKEPIAEIILD